VRHRLILASVAAMLALSLMASSPASQGERGGAANQGQRGGGNRGQQAGPPKPTPRWPDGRVNLGPPPGEKGVWLPGGARLASSDNPNPNFGNAANSANGANAPDRLKVSQVPFQAWAKAVFDFRQENQFEPHTRCKPSGGPRQFFTPYGVEIVDLPELKRIFIFDIGGPHTYRIIYMDGRTHPKDLVPSYYGHSIGRWEGDTLVVDSVGFNEKFWMDREGSPHTEQLHLIERFTRTDFNTMRYEVTVDDSGAYTASWTGGFNLRWSPGQEMFEYVCQDNNHAPELMIGAQESVDRSSRIVP
jgi:hypothetical protein